MSRFSGPQYAGAMRDLRKRKREEAEARNALTPPERRRKFRTDPAARLIAAVFGGAE